MLDTIRFDIEDIIVNHINPNRHSLVYYNQTHVIFNPVSEKLTPIASLTLEMLILCNGKNNVKQIIRQLSKRHKELSSTMRSFCVDSLAFLSNEGYLDIVNEAHALGETPPKVR